MDDNTYVMLFELVTLYGRYKAVIFAALFLNAAIFFFINRYFKKNKTVNAAITYPEHSALHRADYISLSVLCIFFLVWKLFFLGRNDIDGMEIFNMAQAKNILASSSLEGFCRLISYAHQFLYNLTAGIIMKFVGVSCYWPLLRLFSLICSTAVAFLTYLFSYKVFRSRFISFSSVIFLNVHPLFSLYSGRMESYALFCFLALLSYYYFWQVFIAREENRIWKYCLVNALCFLTHYLWFCIILSQLFAVIWAKFKYSLYDKTILVSVSLLNFIRALLLLNFIIILWVPAIHLSLTEKQFLFSDFWSNNFYLTQESFGLIVSSTVKLVLGLPLWDGGISLMFFLILLVCSRVLMLDKDFYVILKSVLLAALLLEIMMLLGLWSTVGRFYFNARYFLWMAPFTAILYGCMMDFFRKEAIIHKRAVNYFILFYLVLTFGGAFYSTNKIIFNRTSPAYKEAMDCVEKEHENGAYIGWPMHWLKGCVQYNTRSIFDGGNVMYRVLTPVELTKMIDCNKEIWLIVPWEDCFGVYHFNAEFMKKYIDFLENKFGFRRVWQGFKIDVYLRKVK